MSAWPRRGSQSPLSPLAHRTCAARTHSSMWPIACEGWGCREEQGLPSPPHTTRVHVCPCAHPWVCTRVCVYEKVCAHGCVSAWVWACVCTCAWASVGSSASVILHVLVTRAGAASSAAPAAGWPGEPGRLFSLQRPLCSRAALGPPGPFSHHTLKVGHSVCKL